MFLKVPTYKMIARFTKSLLVTVYLITVLMFLMYKDYQYKKHYKKPWELQEALDATKRMLDFNGTWITDIELYFIDINRSVYKYNAATDKKTLILRSDFLLRGVYGSDSSFTLSPKNKMILIRYSVEAIFRHSSIAKYDVFSLETGRSTKIHDGKKIQFCNWSPKRDRLAYVYENNVYVHFEDGSEVQLTADGKPGVEYNGIPDWVHSQDVLSTDNTLWWSPDGLKLAVGTPKTVELTVFDVANSRKDLSNTVILDAPIDIVTSDNVVQYAVWLNADNLLVFWLNRRQNVGTMQSCTLVDQCHEIKRFEEPNGWIKISTPICQSSGESCVFRYWIGNWFQVWKLDPKTGNNLWQSRGNFTVTNLYGYDEQNDKLYYQSTLQDQPHVSHVFSNDQCLSCALKDLDNESCRHAAASFSKKFSYYSVKCSGPGPHYSRIYESKTNRLVNDWEPNIAFRESITRKLFPTERFMNVTLTDGSVAAVRLKLPPNLNVRKKYPMIVNVYGGPDSVRVVNTFGVGFDAYITTARNVIYAAIDGRGTGNKGKNFLFFVNNDLGHYEVEDQIFVTKYLQDKLPYVDRGRTGIWGWSYGGYVTAKTIANDAGRVFISGVSVEARASWLHNDTEYWERYFDLPDTGDNLETYNNSNASENVENFKNHEFLLIHASTDDNVYYQQSLALARALQLHSIPFEYLTYAYARKSMENIQSSIYNALICFWNTNLI